MIPELEVKTELTAENVLTKTQRLILGLSVLLLVDVIRVSSSEIIQYIYKNEKFDKPFFTTYFKTSFFSLYLLGLCFWPSWRNQFSSPSTYKYVDSNGDDNNCYGQQNTTLSDPQFVPIKKSDKSSGTESDDSSIHLVRFSKMAEVRHMSDADATEALLSRLSYQASLRAGEVARKSANKFPIISVAKIALTFGFLWFIANYANQASLSQTTSDTGVNVVLSSSSSLFTLMLTAIFPANPGDRFTLTKLIAVLINFSGLVLITFFNFNIDKKVPAEAYLALIGAIFYSGYLVFLRRKVENETKIDIPMFFGFVGFFNLIFLWPIFFVLHFNKWELFEWPNQHEWQFLIFNGLICTFLSEVLWLWGCFLTSSLIATLALSLSIPLAMIINMFFKNVNYSHQIFWGIIPMFLAFFFVAIMFHLENKDPILYVIQKFFFICQYYKTSKSKDDLEQTEALMAVNNENEEI